MKDCKFCGQSHERRRCPAYGRKCAKCGRLNHFAAVCMQLGTNATVRQVTNDLDLEEMQTIRVQEARNDDWPLMVISHDINTAHTQNRLGNKIFVELEINGCIRRLQLDTGATCNVMGMHDLPPHTQLTSTNKILNLYDATTIKPEGAFHAIVSNPRTKEKCEAEFLVVRSERAVPILGAPTSLELSLVVIQQERIHRTEENIVQTNVPQSRDGFIRAFQNLFADGLGRFPGSAHLELDESFPPVKLPVRKVPLAVREDLGKELERLERLGVIVREEQPTAWVSSLVVARKASGKIRVCIDPKPLNKALKRTLYPLPVLDSILPRLRKARVFSICDVASGYWHVALDKQSSLLTTFATPFGRYRWQRLPFGISVAPEIFQTQLDSAISGLEGVATIVDDMLIWGEGESDKEAEEDHDRNLLALMRRCSNVGIKLSMDKFRYKQSEVTYVGHVLSAKGVKSDPRKVTAIRNMDTPTNKAELLRFLGMANYLSKFMPRLSDKCAPLRELLQEKNEWIWTQDRDQAVKDIKEAVSTTPILRYFDTRLPVTIQCDASSVGLGAVLMQQGQPITYASRALSSAEQQYAQIEKELLAVLFAMEKFDQYVYGRHVNVDSDHKPLQVITGKPILSAPKRLQRMLLRLQRYQYTIFYRRGKDMHIADALSRAAGQCERSDQRSHETADMEEVAVVQTPFEKSLEEVNCTQELTVSGSKIERLRAETQKDAALQELERLIQTGWPEHIKEVSPPVRAYFHVRDELCVDNHIIFRGERCVVPTAMRKDVLKKIHEGHIGIEGSLRRAREYVFWPGMSAQVKDTIAKCDVCQSVGQKQCRETLVQTDIALRPWSTVGVDLFYFAT